MNKTSIEWVKNPDGTQGYTWNPITGCLNHVDGMCKGGGFPCYAYRLANGRLKSTYLANRAVGVLGGRYGTPGEAYSDPFYPRFWEDRMPLPINYQHPAWTKKARGIFTCDMSDLFGIGIPEQWTKDVLRVITFNPHHRFYLLTKQPQNLIKWSPFPDNCRVGVTGTNYQKVTDACGWLDNVNAKVKFISIEPLLSWNESINTSAFVNWISDINWIILGACTGRKTEIMELCQVYPDLTPMPFGKIWTAQPKLEWVEEIVDRGVKAGLRVFMKHNLAPLYASHFQHYRLRQELPE